MRGPLSCADRPPPVHSLLARSPQAATRARPGRCCEAAESEVRRPFVGPAGGSKGGGKGRPGGGDSESTPLFSGFGPGFGIACGV